MASDPRTRALYNGDCPVCDAEMRTYERYARHGALPIAFDDLNGSALAAWGVSEDEAARLLHVLHDGRLHVGWDAFLILWEQMPRYRWLSRLGRIPGPYHVLRWGYAHVVARVIYERHLKRRARAGTN